MKSQLFLLCLSKLNPFNSLMKKFSSLYFLFGVFFTAAAQRVNTDYHLRHNIKQDNQQFEFQVLDFGDVGVYQYDKSKFYFWLKAQQVHATQGYSSGLLLHGEFQAFYDNKQLARRGYFHKGLKNSEWLYWNEAGTLVHIEHWRSGVKVGTEKSFSDAGKLLSQVKYKLFKTTRQTPDSTIISWHRKDRQEITLRDNHGQKSKIIRLKNGQLHGRQLEYKENAAVVERYKHGQRLEEKSKKPKEVREEKKSPFSGKWKGLFKKSGDKEKKNGQAGKESSGKSSEKKKRPLFHKKESKTN